MRALRQVALIFPTEEERMRSELQSEYEGTASLKLVTSPWAQPEAPNPALRLRPSVARGIAGRVCRDC